MCCNVSAYEVDLQPLQVVQAWQMCWEEPCNVEADIVLAADVLYDPGERTFLQKVQILSLQ